MITHPHMTKVHSKNTSPEIKLRKLIWHLGFRGYRLHYSKLPGKPDIVFIGRKKVIFIHGCFWHGHDCKAGQNTPRTNLEYWTPKLLRNKTRDQMNESEINRLGWNVLVVWECELKKIDIVENRLKDFLCVSSI
jgi:DNA mismatch endonuclease (patch repair protein)